MAEASIKRIAELAGVSSATVSRCLDPRHSGSVLEKKRAKILGIQKKLGYETNVFARKLRRKCTETITLVLPLSVFENPACPDFSGHNTKLFFEIIQGVTMEAQKSGYEIKILPLFDENPETLKNAVAKAGFPYSDGVILAGIHELEKLHSAIKEKGVPVIVAGTHIVEKSNVAQVASDPKNAIDEALKHLYKKGHRKIAFAAPEKIDSMNEKNFSSNRRFTLFRNALMDLNIYNEKLFFLFEDEISVRNWLAENHKKLPFTALFCNNDAMAFRFVRELKQLDLSVPENLAVMGYDNNSVYTGESGLSTIAIPHREIGREAMKAIVRMIETKEDISGNIILPAKFIKGKTS